MKSEGINRNHQKERNVSLLIRMIHADPECSRAKLSKKTGLGQATVTKLIGQLIDWGVVYEREILDTSKGRKPIRLKLRSDRFLLGAVRLARNYATAGLFTVNGTPFVTRKVEFEGVNAQEAMDRVCALVRTVLQLADRPVYGIGVAVPGPFNMETERISLMSGFPGWEDIDIRKRLEQESKLRVHLEHDANCGAMAELWYGNHAPDASILFVLSDQGVGAGIIAHGEVYHGALGYSGEIGHASINFMGPICECGNRGCIELYASTLTMCQTYLAERLRTDASHNEDITTDDFLELSRRNDPIARPIYERAVSQLAFGLVGFVNTLNPNAVILADPITNGGETFLPIVQDVFHKYLLPQIAERLHVDICRLHSDPMLLGASVVLFEKLIEQPTMVFGKHTLPPDVSL